MEYNLRTYFSKSKPDGISKETYTRHVESGDQKAFYRLNMEKTVISAALTTVSITSLMSGVFDILKNPHPFTMIDLYQITGGITGFLLTVLIIFLIDRAEELRQLRKQEEEALLEQKIKEMLKNEGSGEQTSTES